MKLHITEANKEKSKPKQYPSVLAQTQNKQRPYQIILFFDTQRPKMVQRAIVCIILGNSIVERKSKERPQVLANYRQVHQPQAANSKVVNR